MVLTAARPKIDLFYYIWYNNRSKNAERELGMLKNDVPMEKGAASWMGLKPAILSNAGKALVTEDPDLTDETIKQLVALEPSRPEDYKFYMGEDPEQCEIGLAGISMCIKDNPYATMGEIVARYADMRDVPYAHTAVVLNRLRQMGKFVVFMRNWDDEEYKAVPWSPQSKISKGALMPPPKRHIQRQSAM